MLQEAAFGHFSSARVSDICPFIVSLIPSAAADTVPYVNNIP